MGSGLNRPAGSLDFSHALAPYRGPLDGRFAAHLLRRAGFGGTPGQVRRYAAMTPGDAVASLVHFADTSALPAAPEPFDPTPAIAALRGADSLERRQTLAELRKQMRVSVGELQLWWLNRMLSSPSPLQEKMTLFFHGHFTSAAIQKGVWPSYILQQNQLFRSSALGNLRTLTVAVSQDPAMLLYLDNASSNKLHPNENYARELMELFTLGHGNYTEEDIRQSARAFTGWTVNRRTGSFVMNPRIHDDGTKMFLGRSGNFDGNDIVKIIYEQPACARFWAQSLLNEFVYNDPEPQLVDAVANVVRTHDFELAPIMSTILQSNVFFSARAYRALLKSPVEYVVGTHNVLGLDRIEIPAVRALSQMGQVLFYPPNVAGWPGGTNWITSQTSIARENFIAGLVNSPLMSGSWVDRSPMQSHAASKELIDTILQNDAAQQAYAQLTNYLDGSNTSALGTFSAENFQERVRGAAYLTMAMPAYQLN